MIEQPIRFVHLYFTSGALARRTVHLLDVESHLFTLCDRTFIEDMHFVQACVDITQLDWTDLGDRIRANTLANDTLSYLVQTQGRTRVLAAHGRSAPHMCRRIAAHIDVELHLSLSLGRLAAGANLPEFHFMRMFRASFRAASYEWAIQQRMARA